MKYLKTNPSLCKGIKACEKVCAKTFFKVEDPEKSAIRVTQTDSGFEINVCNQCGECIAVCPVLALKRNSQGVVMLDKKLCVGCLMCVGYCPTLSMRTHPDQREPFKCVACGICARACPEKALEIAER
ncbi:MAG: 4Fe-4S binding protein [Candidatus Edwardsbacteria bacterium]|nr:4Fe-4S binding protein [Candidatus Edwardsbacteria bacterium]MBU1575993.1 4Fe-4S binding protein [Candidatus Edwardsbacteria bacterium]MBU2463440.1 4Fe-4S binding protein [Candidatus Edwardsbacteria bacterium]MBU2595054.1 4Fe-4S binding protein [Candidatus Edwardsbacteria bacterium]